MLLFYNLFFRLVYSSGFNPNQRNETYQKAIIGTSKEAENRQ